MPRYFFDIHDGAHSTDDESGLELDGIEAARQEAVKTLAGIAQEILSEGDLHEAVIEVKDENHHRVLVARFSAGVERVEPSGLSPEA